jgi:polyhydroxyalkanoate synthesis regulator phasin
MAIFSLAADKFLPFTLPAFRNIPDFNRIPCIKLTFGLLALLYWQEMHFALNLKLWGWHMFELFEKAFMTGLGAVSMSQKKAEELLVEIKEKYKISEEEGKALLEKLQTMAKDSRSKISEAAESEVQKVIERIGLVPREDFDRLRKRVDELESRLAKNDQGPEC